MIVWKYFPEYVPPVDEDDSFNKLNKMSKRLLVALTSTQTRSKIICFGQYFHESNHWSFDGFRGDATVEAWSEVNEPDLS